MPIIPPSPKPTPAHPHPEKVQEVEAAVVPPVPPLQAAKPPVEVKALQPKAALPEPEDLGFTDLGKLWLTFNQLVSFPDDRTGAVPRDRAQTDAYPHHHHRDVGFPGLGKGGFFFCF